MNNYPLIMYNNHKIYWYILHYFAILYPVAPSLNDKKIWFNFYNFFDTLLPPIYKYIYLEFKTKHKIELFLNNSFDLFKWTFLLHQKINYQFNKMKKYDLMLTFEQYYHSRFEHDRFIEFLLTLTKQSNILKNNSNLHLSDIKYFILLCHKIIKNNQTEKIIPLLTSQQYNLNKIRRVLLTCINNYIRWIYYTISLVDL